MFNSYVTRLSRCGYPMHRAYATCRSFLRELSESDLVSFIVSLEERCYNNVGVLQSKSNRAQSR